MNALAKKVVSLETNNATAKPVARFLLLARKIHAKYTQQEEQERAALRAADASAKRKNEAIMQPVREVVEFCQILTQTPGLMEAFSSKAKDIAERTLSNRYAYTMEEEPIAVNYQVPVYSVNMKAADGTVMSGAENAYLSVGICPVQISPSSERPLDVPTMTAHTFFGRKYHIEPTGQITDNKKEADPIADIIEELRSRMGRDYFEQVLLPHFEAQAQKPRE